MTTKDDGGPAFPTMDNNGHGLVLREWGMSRREYHASNAMNGLMAGYFTGVFMGDAEREMVELRPDQMATVAVQAADALIAALARGGRNE